MKFRIRFANQVVGVFVLFALLALAAVMILMGINQRWFSKSYQFTSQFNSADGLTAGMGIKLRGFEIGKVEKVNLTPTNRVDVDFVIYNEYYEKIRPNSVLELATSPIGLGGGLNFLPGKNQLPPTDEHTLIPSTDMILGRTLIAQGKVDKPEGDQAINGIIAQVEPLLVEVRGAVQNVNTLLGLVNGAVNGSDRNQIYGLVTDVRSVLQNTDKTIVEAGGQTGAILGNVNKLTAQLQSPKGLIPLLLDPKGSLATLLNDDNKIFNEIFGIFNKLQDSVAQINLLAKFINKSQPQISGLIEESREAIKQTTGVMEGLKNNPLLRGGVTPEKPQNSPIQSNRDEGL